MKKSFSVILAFLVMLFLCGNIFCSISGGTYLTVQTSELGKIRIYIDDSYVASFGLDDSTDLPVLCRSGSITGYTLDSSGVQNYRITIYPFAQSWTYRLLSGSYNTYDLTVTDYFRDESNITVNGLDFDISKSVPYILVFFGIVILIFLIWRK